MHRKFAQGVIHILDNCFLLCRCARFILHYKHHHEEYSSHIHPQTSYAHALEQGSQKQMKPHSPASRIVSAPNRNAFEQGSLKGRSGSLSERQSLLPNSTGKQPRKTSLSDTRLPKKEMPEAAVIRATVSDQHLASAAKLPEMAAAHPPNYKALTEHTPSHTSRTLRYMVHHFPQVPSRASSVMVYCLFCISLVFHLYFLCFV